MVTREISGALQALADRVQAERDGGGAQPCFAEAVVLGATEPNEEYAQMSGMVLIASEWDVDQELPPNSSRNAIPRICHERVPTHDVVWSELLTGSGTYGGARVTALAARVIKESTARAAACSIAGSVPSLSGRGSAQSSRRR